MAVGGERFGGIDVLILGPKEDLETTLKRVLKNNKLI